MQLDPQSLSNQDDFVAALVELLRKSGMSRREVQRQLARAEIREKPAPATVANWFTGQHLPNHQLTPAFVQMLIIMGVQKEDLAAWQDALRRVRSAPGPRPSASPSPYRGLLSYGIEDAAFFAGRDAVIAQLAEHIREHAAGGRMTVMVGPSGSGKSSLLRAGLLPVLTVGGPTPVVDLVVSGHDVVQKLEDARTALAVGGSDDAPQTVIIVDQLEQMFLTCPDRDQQTALLEVLELAAAGSDSLAKAIVVLTLRSDFYTRALEIPALFRALQFSQFVVGPMSEEELRQAVSVPADRAGIVLQPGLVDVVLRDLTPVRTRTAKDAAHEAGTLPMLSHTMFKTWEMATGSQLTIDHYRATGGIEGAVAKTAEEAFGSLGASERQDLARRIFLRLAQSDDDQIYTRRRVSWDEILDLGSENEHEWQEVLDLFISARLLTADEDFVQIAHEALLSAWPRLTEWLDADQGWHRIHQRIRTAVHEWIDTSRDSRSLLRGPLLQTAQEWVTTRGYGRELIRQEAEFLQESQRQQELDEAIARAQTRRRYVLTSLLAVFAVITASVLVIAQEQRTAADRQEQAASVARAEALSRLIADKADRLRELDPALGAQLSIVAYRTAPTSEARSSLLNSTATAMGTRLRPSLGKPKSVAVAANGDIAAGTDTGNIQLWTQHGNDAAQRGGLLHSAGRAIVKLAFSLDGQQLAGADNQGSVFAWNLRSPDGKARTLGKLDDEAASIAWSADNTAVFAAWDNRISMLSASGQAAPPKLLTAGTAPLRMIAVSPDGKTLAAGSEDSNVYLWNISNQDSPQPSHQSRTPTAKSSRCDSAQTAASWPQAPPPNMPCTPGTSMTRRAPG
jgi:energy-coupling factor transporter ATP-binding protein EcfA2